MPNVYRQKTSNYRTYLPIPHTMGYTAIGIGGCYNLRGYKITVPEGVEVIEPYAFAGCDEISYIELPSTLKTIGEGAFLGCVSLRSLTVPEGVETIGDLAFYDCGSRVHFGKTMPLTLPDSVKNIGQNVFGGVAPRGEAPKRQEFSAKIRFVRGNTDKTFTLNEIDPYTAKRALTSVADRPFVLLGVTKTEAVIYSYDDEVSLVLPLGEAVHCETTHVVGAAYEYTDLTTTYHYISDFTLTDLSFT